MVYAKAPCSAVVELTLEDGLPGTVFAQVFVVDREGNLTRKHCGTLDAVSARLGASKSSRAA